MVNKKFRDCHFIHLYLRRLVLNMLNAILMERDDIKLQRYKFLKHIKKNRKAEEHNKLDVLLLSVDTSKDAVGAVLYHGSQPIAYASASLSSGRYIPRPSTRQCFLRSLSELTNLRILALEYSHIADGSGKALLSLLPVLKRPHFRFQLICREDQVPGRVNPKYGVGGFDIPDTAWKTVAFACPDLYLLMAFFRIRDYDNVRRFLTPSMPLRETHLDLGIDLNTSQRQDSDVSCFVRHIAYQYASILVTLSIHQWRFATFPLRRVFELMPRLVRFFYIGMVDDESDLRRSLEIVASGVCERLKQMKLQIQYEEANRDHWQKVVHAIADEYSGIMEFFEIDFCIDIFNK